MSAEGAAGQARPAKKARTLAGSKQAAAFSAVEEQEVYADEHWAEGLEEPAEAPPKKKQPTATDQKSKTAKALSKRKPPPKGEDLLPGTVVLYWDGWRGVIRDAFAPIDQYWLVDEESGELVKDDDTGDIVQFRAADLELVASVPVARPRPEELRGMPLGGVLLLAAEEQMVKIIEHFGNPSADTRTEPQVLLAIPCSKCDPPSLLPCVADEVEAPVRQLACDLRPDIHVALRSYHFRQAAEKLGADLLRLEDYFCLSAVHVPYSKEDIAASASEWERRWREEVCNQIDLCVSAGGWFEDEFTAEDAARRALGEQCGIEVSEELWDEDAQRKIRQRIGAADLPLHFTDDNCMRVFTLIVPQDAVATEAGGLVRFSQAPQQAEFVAARRARPAAPAAGATLAAPAPQVVQARPAVAAPQIAPAEVSGPTVGGKTVSQWEREQGQFANLPRLPPDWIRIKSNSTGEVYFFNKRTKQSTFEIPESPLPPGWTKHTSKSTGNVYYFNATRKESTFTRPTA